MNNDVDLTFRALKDRPAEWNRDSGNPRTPAQFEAPYSDTVHRLKYELGKLDTEAAWLQVELADPVRGVRNDGQLRADARALHPGVILTAETPAYGTLIYPCDQFVRGPRSIGDDWQQNVRAIALGLEALRKLDRYGIAARGQQYAGFRELGAGTAMGGTTMSDDQVAKFLATAAGLEQLDRTDPDAVRRAYLAAAKRHHPDTGGNPAMMGYIVNAYNHLTA